MSLRKDHTITVGEDVGQYHDIVGYIRKEDISLGQGKAEKPIGSINNNGLFYTSEFFEHAVNIDAVWATIDKQGNVKQASVTFDSLAFESIGQQVIVEFAGYTCVTNPTLVDGNCCIELAEGAGDNLVQALGNFLNSNRGQSVQISIYPECIGRSYNDSFMRCPDGDVTTAFDITKTVAEGYVGHIQNNLREQHIKKITLLDDRTTVRFEFGTLRDSFLRTSDWQLFGVGGHNQIPCHDEDGILRINVDSAGIGDVINVNLWNALASLGYGCTVGFNERVSPYHSFYYNRYTARLLPEKVENNKRFFNRFEWVNGQDVAVNNNVFFEDKFMGELGTAIENTNTPREGNWGFIEKMWFDSIEDLSTGDITHVGYAVFNETVFPRSVEDYNHVSVWSQFNITGFENRDDPIGRNLTIMADKDAWEGRYAITLGGNLYKGKTLGEWLYLSQRKMLEIPLTWACLGSSNWYGEIVARGKPSLTSANVIEHDPDNGRYLLGYADGTTVPKTSKILKRRKLNPVPNRNGYEIHPKEDAAKVGDVIVVTKADGHYTTTPTRRVEAIVEPNDDKTAAYTGEAQAVHLYDSIGINAVDFNEVVYPLPEGNNTTVLSRRFETYTEVPNKKNLVFGYSVSKAYIKTGMFYPTRIEGQEISLLAYSANVQGSKPLLLFNDLTDDGYEGKELVGRLLQISVNGRYLGEYEITDLTGQHELVHHYHGKHGVIIDDQGLKLALENNANHDGKPVFMKIKLVSNKEWFGRYIFNVRSGNTTDTSNWRGNQLILWEDFQLMMALPPEDRYEVFVKMNKIFEDNSHDVFLEEQLFRDHNTVNISNSNKDMLMALCRIFLLPNGREERQVARNGLDIDDLTAPINDFEFRQNIRHWLDTTF